MFHNQLVNRVALERYASAFWNTSSGRCLMQFAQILDSNSMQGAGALDGPLAVDVRNLTFPEVRLANSSHRTTNGQSIVHHLLDSWSTCFPLLSKVRAVLKSMLELR